MKWIAKITLPEHDGENDAITQERLTEEVNQLCQAGFDLEPDEYTVEVTQAPAKVERTGTEG